MIKHVVLFAFDGFTNAQEKTEHLIQVKDALEALPVHIDCLQSLYVQLNENSSEQYDLILEAQVESMQTLSEYSAHPLHQDIVLRLIKPYLLSRACVDYTFTE